MEPVADTKASAPQRALQLAQAALREFPECFFWADLTFVPQTNKDVRLIVESLRRGNHRAWNKAQEIHQCL